jgi:hypothetical protein
MSEEKLKTGCTCPVASFCQRHQIEKTPHMHKLCQNHEGYFKMWEECRGPGQQNISCQDNGIKITRGEQKEEEVVVDKPIKMPSLIQQAKNLAIATKDHIKNGMRKVDQDKKEWRLSICKTCPYFKKDTMRCGHCGCFLETKTQWESSTCPIGKW